MGVFYLTAKHNIADVSIVLQLKDLSQCGFECLLLHTLKYFNDVTMVLQLLACFNLCSTTLKYFLFVSDV